MTRHEKNGGRLTGTERIAIHTVLDDPDLLIRWMPGSSNHLVLAFTGALQSLNGIPDVEFAGSSSEQARNHVLFVSDLRNSWYSLTGMVARIVALVTDFAGRHDITSINTVGTSMGGYGAILIAGHLPVQNVAAFAPQVSMNGSFIRDQRWRRRRDGLGPEVVDSVAPVVSRSTSRFFLTFGRNAANDLAQAALLPRADNLQVHYIDNCGHGVAQFLKSRGILSAVIAAKFAGDAVALQQIYDRFAVFNWDRRLSFLQSVPPRLKVMKTRLSQDIARLRGIPA